MGERENPKVRPGGRLTTFVGEAVSDGSEPPTLNDALESAAGQAVEAGLIGGVDDEGRERTAWFDITFVEVELGNQHPRAIKVGVTTQQPGG